MTTTNEFFTIFSIFGPPGLKNYPRASKMSPKAPKSEPQTPKVSPRTLKMTPQASKIDPRITKMSPRAQKVSPRTLQFLNPSTTRSKYRRFCVPGVFVTFRTFWSPKGPQIYSKTGSTSERPRPGGMRGAIK